MLKDSLYMHMYIYPMHYNCKDAMFYIHVVFIQLGFTALHWASKKGNFEVVKVLTEKGARIDIPAKVQLLLTIANV